MKTDINMRKYLGFTYALIFISAGGCFGCTSIDSDMPDHSISLNSESIQFGNIGYGRSRGNPLQKPNRRSLSSSSFEFVLNFPVFKDGDTFKRFWKMNLLHKNTCKKPLKSRIVSTKKSEKEHKDMRKLYECITEETQVNTSTLGAQECPFALALPEDRTIIFWVDDETTTINGQIFDLFLNKIGSEFTINSSSNPPGENRCRGTVLTSGLYVATWENSDEDIYARIMTSDTGEEEFKVNVSADGTDIDPDACSSPDGGFLIVWSSDSLDFFGFGYSYKIMAKRYDANGDVVGDEMIVDSNIDKLGWPRCAFLNDGSFVVAWEQKYGDSDGYGIKAKIYDSSEEKFGDTISVNTYTEGDQEFCSIAVLTNGKFIIAWDSANQDSSSDGVFAQMFESSGDKFQGEFQVNTYTKDNQRYPFVISLEDGGFLITWRSEDQDGDEYGVYAQRYDEFGSPIDAEFIINTTTEHGQTCSKGTAINNGLLLAWDSNKQDGDSWGIYARTFFYDNPASLTLINPMEDMSVYQFQSFLFTVPADTFQTSIDQGLSYSVTMSQNGENVDVASSWLSFDPDTQTFTGTPIEVASYLITVNVQSSCAENSDEFLLDVLLNEKPVVNSPIPPQDVPFDQNTVWEFYIPDDTFVDNEGDTITYTNAVMMISGEEKDLNIVWGSLQLENNKLSGTPDTIGEYTVRIYADDGTPSSDPTPIDIQITVHIFVQGIEILELYTIDQRGSTGIITQDNSYIWIANDTSLKRFEVTSQYPLNIQAADLEYTMLASINTLKEMNDSRLVVGDSQGNIEVVSASEALKISQLSIGQSISDVLIHEETSFYVSHLNSLSMIEFTDNQLAVNWTVVTDKQINGIAKLGDFIYAATSEGLLEISILDKSYVNLSSLESINLVDLDIHENHLYTVEGTNMHIIDISDRTAIKTINFANLEGNASSLLITKKDEDVLCLVTDDEGINIRNVTDPNLAEYVGYYESLNLVNGIHVESSGSWGIVFKETEFMTVELFRRELTLDVCDTGSDPCTNEQSIHAQTDFSKDIKVIESIPQYKIGYKYDYTYAISAVWIIEGFYNPLPSWLIISEVDTKAFKLTGNVPDMYIGSVVEVELIVNVFDSVASVSVLDLSKIVSLSIVPREASLIIAIPDQSLEVGNEWLFTFDENTFSDADEYECKYVIENEVFSSLEIGYIEFYPSLRQWYIHPGNSNKETLFRCDPCADDQYSKTYIITVTGKNSASDTDIGISTSFYLYLYSGRIPDQETHPGISETIILDENIFPEGIDYAVSLLDENGDPQSLPSWMSYIANERKILMFPTVDEIGQEFDILVSGDSNGTEFRSEFTIRVVNNDPVVLNSLENQRVKLGTQLDYVIPIDTFSDPDEDPLTYSMKWLKEDGTETNALPEWIKFDENTRTVYGVPSSKEFFVMKVYVNDGLGGEMSTELVIEAYNNTPQRNSEIPLEDQSFHIGVSLSFTLWPDLFIDTDGDSLTYTAKLTGDLPLPPWLIFSSITLSFSGTPTDTDLLSEHLSISVTASDGFATSSTAFILEITNEAPLITNSINSQVNLALEQGNLELKPGKKIDFVLSSDTCTDRDDDTLEYIARLSNEESLPMWLTFDERTLQFFGIPSVVEELSISIICTDTYAVGIDTFVLSIENKLPRLNSSLQEQFDLAYSANLVDGDPFSFQFNLDTFIDEDDSLAYSALLKIDGGSWGNLDSSWISFEERTFSGTISTDSIKNTKYSLQVTASDGYSISYDEFSFTVASIYPDPNGAQMHIGSSRDTVTIEIYTRAAQESCKIAVFNYGTAIASDLSNDSKTHWKIEGSPSDLNYVLDRVKYRISSVRRLSEVSVYLRIKDTEQEYPVSVFTPEESIVTYPIPNQNAYIDNTFSLSIKGFFEYSNQDDLTYTFEILEMPRESKDWLKFDSITVSGNPVDDENIGKYVLNIKATDQFNESKIESFKINVDYSDMQKFYIYLNLAFRILGPAITVIGFIRYRSIFVNFCVRSKKRHSFLRVGNNEINVRQLLILRTDEEEMANKLYIRLNNNYDLSTQNLATDLDLVVKDINTKTKQNSEVEDDKQEDYPSKNTIQHCLENDRHSIVEIKEKNYHGKFLYLCVKDLIYAETLNQKERKELDSLVFLFKEEMISMFRYQNSNINHYDAINDCIGKRDAWAMALPNLINSLNGKCPEVESFLANNETNIQSHVFYNRIVKEYWRDRSIRVKDKSNLKTIRLFYRVPFCCKMYIEKNVQEWLCREWFKVEISDKALTITVNSSRKHIIERFSVQVMDENGYILSEICLLPVTSVRNSALTQEGQWMTGIQQIVTVRTHDSIKY